MQLSYNSQFLFQKNGVESGISDKTQSEWQAKIDEAITRVEEQRKNGEYGFINILSNSQHIDQIKKAFAEIRWAKNLVVVGIGGSDLGARAIFQAIEEDEPPFAVYFHGDSSDPVAITRLMREIDLGDTVFCIISKSGETIETISQYVFFKHVFKTQYENWQDHFIFITDAQKGILREEADANNILTLPIPDDVGGRFSVQTSVGLFPALAMGVDIDQLIAGAKDGIENHSKVAQQIAMTQFLLAQQGIDINVMMPYSVQLEEFARWYRQLWAESLGKEGKGILPIQARGPADQHSQVQFYTEGKLMQSLLFLRIDHRLENYVIEQVDVKNVEYLEGLYFHDIVNAELEATALALKKLGRPSATLAIDKLDAFSLGQLFAVFELAVVYLSEMMDIDAFNQPGVEEGKQMMYALLGRKGWEEKRKEIEELK